VKEEPKTVNKNKNMCSPCKYTVKKKEKKTLKWNNPVVILRFTSDSADRGRSIIRVMMTLCTNIQ
jgi:hypothetical protein